MEHYHTNKTFDPYTQQLSMFGPDGTTRVFPEVKTVIYVQHLMVVQSVSQGTQIGAAAVLLIALLLLTKREKRRSAVFIHNGIALFLVIVRGIFSCITFTSPIYDWYRVQTYWYSNTGWAKAVSACGATMSFLLISVIIASLMLQIHIVCVNLTQRQRLAVDITSACVAFIAITTSLAVTVISIDWNIIHLESQSQRQFHYINVLARVDTIILVICIAYATVIFCAKLFLAIKSRYSLGLKQFGPLQIVFVMGCQTMLTPLIFTIISYWGAKNAQMESFVPTIVALSLPLSALWAAANTNNVHIAESDKRGNRPLLIGVSDSTGGNTSRASRPKVDSIITAQTLLDDDTTGLNSASSKSRSPDIDLEMQKLGGVIVNRTYGVHVD